MSSRAKSSIAAFLAVVLGMTVLGAVVAGAAAALRPQTYTSTATLMVTPQRSLPSAEAQTVAQYILGNMPTYDNLATTSSVLRAADGHGVSADEISRNVAVEVPAGSTLLKLAYTDTDRERGTGIADDLAKGLQESIRTFSPNSNGSSQVDAALVQEAGTATTTNTSKISRWAALGGGAGLVVGLALAQAVTARRRARGPWAATPAEDGAASS